MKFLYEYMKKTGFRRIWMMFAGSVVLCMGISIFRLAGLGNDPYNGMLLGVSAKSGIPYGTFALIVAAGLFVLQVIFERGTIGIGTFFNLIFQGYLADFFYLIWTSGLHLQPSGFAIKLLVVCIGVCFTSFGLSMYQTADAGIAPYDSVSLMLVHRVPKLGYFAFRVLSDGICALICFLTGGIVGVGMLIAAFGQGPIIQFFNHRISEPLLNK